MKPILLILCIAGLGLGGQCGQKELTPEEQAAALEQAKQEAEDMANKAIGQAIVALAKYAGTPANTHRIETLKSEAEGALEQAKNATTVEEANEAKDQAKDAYDQLLGITNWVEIFQPEEDTDLEN